MANIIQTTVLAPLSVINKLLDGDQRLNFNGVVSMPLVLRSFGCTEYFVPPQIVKNYKKFESEYLAQKNTSYESMAIWQIELTVKDCVKAFAQANPDVNIDVDNLAKRMTTLALTGFEKPSDWAMEHWGVTGQGFDEKLTIMPASMAKLSFCTKWASPHAVLTALSRQHPDILISVDFVDEDYPDNKGSYRILNGEVSNIFFGLSDNRITEKF